MKLIKSLLISLAVLGGANSALAADYTIDTKGAHASIGFKFKHINIAWLTGHFNEFDGSFSYDPDDLAASKIEVNIQTASLDSNHAERDKHIRSEKFLNTDEFPTAKFVSTKVEPKGGNAMTVYGDLTLYGVTKEIAIESTLVGEGDDPWGGYRAGFSGEVTLNTLDFGFKLPPSSEITMVLNLEGKKNK